MLHSRAKMTRSRRLSKFLTIRQNFVMIFFNRNDDIIIIYILSVLYNSVVKLSQMELNECVFLVLDIWYYDFILFLFLWFIISFKRRVRRTRAHTFVNSNFFWSFSILSFWQWFYTSHSDVKSFFLEYVCSEIIELLIC